MSFSFNAVAFERGSVGFPQPPGSRGCGGWRKPGGASPSWVLGSGHRDELWSEFGRRTQINTVKPGYRKVASCLVRAVFALCLKTCSGGWGASGLAHSPFWCHSHQPAPSSPRRRILEAERCGWDRAEECSGEAVWGRTPILNGSLCFSGSFRREGA